jgi:3-dehydroquinate synthase
MKIYTRTGDEGETGLFGGGRVPKDHPRVSAYGDVDELNAALGVARATAPGRARHAGQVQRDLFSIGGYLATPDPAKVAAALAKAELPPERIEEFERAMDAMDAELPSARWLPAGAPGRRPAPPGPSAGVPSGRSPPGARRSPAVHHLPESVGLLFTLAARQSPPASPTTPGSCPTDRPRNGSYTVTIGPAYSTSSPIGRHALARRPVAVITDGMVAALCRPARRRPWRRALLPRGSSPRPIRTLTDAFSAGLTRDAAIVALGGGMIGDLAGFVAATYARGIPFIQVPTTLLAMVDSSVGGKTGVDTPLGKNLVGAFHPPAAVLADPLVLQSLPPQHLRCGLAEMAKHGLIADAGYWHDLGAHATALQAREPEALTRFIARSVEIKAAVVMEDERETGRRAVLNAGHTVAHAVEHASGFAVSHGDAVAMGLVAEAHLAESLGVAVPGLADRVTAGLRQLSLPTRLPVDIDANRLFEAMRSTKRAADSDSRSCTISIAARDAERWTVPVSDTHAIVHALRATGTA